MISQHQKQQLTIATSNRVGLLTGTPGTGKTYTLAKFVRDWGDRYGLGSIAVCAPTGKAGVRCTESMLAAGVDIEATTIHRLLGVGRNGHDGEGWGFEYNAENPLPHACIVVDETSMVSASLMADLLAATTPHTRLVFVGDPHQLPPVGHGAPLRDLIRTERIPHGELSEIWRNDGGVVRICREIRNQPV